MIRLTLVLLSWLVACGIAAPAHAQAPPRAERPTYEIGQRWVRNDGVYELIRMDGDRYVFAARAGQQIHLSRDLVPVRMEKGKGLFELDPAPKLDWPLQVGKSGSSWVTWRWEDFPAGAYTRFVWSVTGHEDIVIPAGQVKAFRIDVELQSHREGGRGIDAGRRTVRTSKWTMWYAPDAKLFVKMEALNPMGQPWRFASYEVATFERPAPLSIAVEGPADGAQSQASSVVVKGRAQSGAGVKEVIFTVNGTEVRRETGSGSSRRELAFSVPVTLAPGKNLILVTAIDAAGARQQEARVVLNETAVASTPPAPAPAPRRVPLVGPPPGAGTPAPPVAAPPPVPAVAVPPSPAPVTPPSVAVASPAATPLSIALSSPADRSRLEQDLAVLAGIVSGGKGIARVVVTLNGSEVARQDEKAGKPAMALNVPLKLQPGGNTIVVTAADVDGRLSQEVRSIQFDKVMPLAIAISYPADNARVSEETSVVTALLTSSKGVATAKVLLNGTEVWTKAERAPQRSVAVAAPVTLKPGPNAFVLTAAESDGTVRQEVRTVVYDPPKVAAVPPAATPPPPPVRNQWAVVIGVGHYDSKDIPRLRYTVSDAEAIYQTLIGPGGFKKDNVMLLTDRSDRKPTLRNVKWALGTFLGRSAQKDDTVLIFFAGHGAPEVDARGLERDGLAKYLIPSDADADDLYSTALPMDELQTIFSRIEAERVVAFLDACYSGAAGGRTFATKKTRAGAVDDLFLERLTRSKGRAIITASRPNEVSIELTDLGHGIFTYYLVQGLKGGADLNRDGIVSLQELYEYVEAQVTKKSRAVGGNQHPVMKGELEGALPLVKVGK